jgi:hypothetical protein
MIYLYLREMQDKERMLLKLNSQALDATLAQAEKELTQASQDESEVYDIRCTKDLVCIHFQTILTQNGTATEHSRE